MTGAYRRAFVGTTDSALLQTNIEQAFKKVLRNPILDGVLLENIAVSSSGVTLVEHKLARNYKGYWVVKNGSTSVGIAVDLTSDADRSLYLPLLASGTDTISLWVF